MSDTSTAGHADTDQPDRSAPTERTPRVPFVVLILALLGGGLCALLILNTVTAATEVRQRSVDAANASLNDTQQQLSRDIASLQAPDDLARQAAKLGLIPADSPAFIRLDANGVATVLGDPAPATTEPSPPAPTPTPTPTATPTATPTPTLPTTARPSGTSTAKPTGTKATATVPKPKPKPTPTNTPTPTVTLPGGPR